MIDLDTYKNAYPAVAAENAKQAAERAQYDRWQRHADATGAENQRRLEEWQEAQQRANELGIASPDSPPLLVADLPPFNKNQRTADWFRRSKAALVQHADEIRGLLDDELAALSEQSKSLLSQLDALSRRHDALINERHGIDIAERDIDGVPLSAQPHAVSAVSGIHDPFAVDQLRLLRASD